MSSSNLNRNDLLIFSLEDKKTSHLRSFLSFLKWEGVKRPFRFSYVAPSGPLLSNLSLKQNIILDSIPISMGQKKSFELEKYLEEVGNVNLYNLFKKIDFIEDLPHQVDAQNRKIAALIKGLLQDAEFLFLDLPELGLDSQNVQLFIKALEYKLRTKGQITLLASHNESQWHPLATKKVIRLESGEYQINPVLKKLMEREYFPQEDGILEFSIPDKLEEKKSA